MAEGNPYHEDDASVLTGEVFSGKLSIEEALQKLRTRLLDLSMRNRLLNYRLPKGRSFQFTDDPDLNLVYERLEEGRTVPLAYVPDPPTERYEAGKKPEARTYAKELGIGTSVDVARSSQSTAYKRLQGLQVLQYPADLERSARKVSSEARTVVEETGTNMLYLMFGFLEYFDSDDSDKAVHAPLLSMPVTLTKGNLDSESRTYLYELSYSGEDIAENFTLREKLRQQFRLELPELGEENTPEDYFEKIQAAVSKRRNWNVRRRLTLGFLSFGKLAIWADLDPAKAGSLLSSELLRSIFGGGPAGASDAFHAEDYDIDSHADGELPLIYDADSSQHSALIDVKSGKSLVINGPPGTGKSQTITNIIATTLADGKKVLFVSEKLAALEVVKQRLEAAGLGDFCLELHSHKTQKKQLLESIEQRMTKRYSAPVGYNKRIEVLRERRKALNAYAQLLGSRLGNQLELTVHDVFWTTERKRQALGSSTDAVSGLSVPGSSDWRAEEVDRRRTILADAASALQEMGCAPKESPWQGFYPSLLIKGDEVPIVRVVSEALSHAQAMESAANAVSQELEGQSWSMQQFADASTVVEVIEQVDDELNGALLESMFPGGIGGLERANGEARRLQVALSHVRELQARAAAGLVHGSAPAPEAFQRHAELAQRVLSRRGLETPVEQLGALAQQMQFLLTAVREACAGRNAAIARTPAELALRLQAHCDTAELVCLTSIPAGDLRERADAAERVAGEVSAKLEQVGRVLATCRVPFSGRVDEVQLLLDGRGFYELLPDADDQPATQDALRQLVSGGWQDWTAGQFTATAKEISERLAVAGQAAEELKAFFSRLAVPVETTRAGLEAIEALIAAAENAPSELLARRGPGLERPDFPDIAIKAEDTHKSLAHKTTKISTAFHVDTLPDEEQLRLHVRVFRRGDSVLNFLRSDWRQAKAAFRECSKSGHRLKAQAMGELFSAVLSWRTAQVEFERSEYFRSALGPLFEGMKTDFARVRRLHAWVRGSQATLLATDLGPHINLNIMAEQHIALLAGSAPRVRAWVGHLKHLIEVVRELPGVDPALTRVRRVDDLFKPLDDYARSLERSAALLKSTVRPTASVQRAVDLLELRKQIHEHADDLRTLEACPVRLASAAGVLGLAPSALSHRDLKASTLDIVARARVAKEMADSLAANCGDAYTVRDALVLLNAFMRLQEHASTFLTQRGVPVQGDLPSLLEAREEHARCAEQVSRHFVALARPGLSLETAIAASQAHFDAAAALEHFAADKAFGQLFGVILGGVDTDEPAIERCLRWAHTVKSVADRLPSGTANQLLRSGAPGRARALVTAVRACNEALSRYKASMVGLGQWGRFEWQHWGGAPRPNDAVERLQRALAGGAALVAWSKFLAAKDDAAKHGLQEVLARSEQGKISPSDLVTAFEYVFFRTLSRGILAAHKELARFSGTGHERLRREFSELDKELISLNGAMYAAKVDAGKKLSAGVSYGRAGDLTEMALLTKETKKQKRHIPIRQLLKRAGRSLQQLKPCFMMGPLSVAQYLEQGHLEFDLIVMDEASQLRPEDALGAIARGKQLVVVGDPKQLPPTNFFDRLMDDDSEDADEVPAIVEGVESILGICEHLYRPVRTLRWHYRSRHESLIAFSNSQFYDQRLVVFPSPYRRNKRLGVNYRYVREGIYQDRKNHPEAQRVVDAVLEHMLTCPEESLGVVTLNQTQRELVEDLLDRKLRSLAGAAEYLDRHEKAGWPFFVKNLENVQGDERDVIFVSTTFGKPPGSAVVRQGFGPINRADGWRRLNVLFTRARRRIDLFTSMLPEDVKLDERVSLGRRALHDYLEYARSGRLPGDRGAASERDADSDFEIAVADALKVRGFETEPQVGVAGYFIDLGVRHPQRRSEFLAGIECDGVTYHSSLSARDRDRIRQEILESLGWRGRIIRVWSTDWFADPAGQCERLVKFLEQRRVEDQAQPAPYSDEDLAEFHEFTEVANVPTGEGASSTVADDAAATEPSTETLGPELFVELGDRVTYEMLTEPRERHTVQIVDSASNLKLGILNDHTPLAQALMGLCAGDEADLRVKDQPARRMRVVRIVRQTEDAVLTADDGTA